MRLGSWSSLFPTNGSMGASPPKAPNITYNVQLTVCPLTHLKNLRPNFTDFLCMLPVDVAQSSSDGVMLCIFGFVDDVMFSYTRHMVCHLSKYVSKTIHKAPIISHISELEALGIRVHVTR